MASSPRAAENIATLPVSEAAVHVLTAPATSRQGDVLTCPNPTVLVKGTAPNLTALKDEALAAPPTGPAPPSSRRSKPTPMTMDIDRMEAPLSRGGVVKSETSGMSTIMFFLGIAVVVAVVGFVSVRVWGPEKDLKRTLATTPVASGSAFTIAEPPPVDPSPAPPVATTDDNASSAPSASPSNAPPRRTVKKAPAPKPSARGKH
jgi:hypothetical protein